MRFTSTLAPLGLFVALTASCVGWSPLPKAGVPLRSDPPPLWPLVETAPVAKVSMKTPAPVPKATIREASAPEDVSPPAPARRRSVRRLRSQQILDAKVLDSAGQSFGRIRDVLLDPGTGAVVGVLVARTLSDGAPVQSVLHLRMLEFSADNSNVPEIAFREAAVESPLDGIDYSDLIESYGITEIDGEIVEAAPLESSFSGAIILKIHDEGNLLHRVLVEPGLLVMHFADDWKPGKSVRVNGALTRDSVGKLLVANTVTTNGDVLHLRDKAGNILWEELAMPFQSARGLNNHAIVTSDGTEHAVINWVLDRDHGRVSHLGLLIDGKARALKWAAVQRNGDAWSVAFEQASLAKLPLFPRKVGDAQPR